MTTIGISYFWFLGALLQMALLLFGQHALHVADAAISRLLHGARRRHRRGQPGRRPAVGRQGRARPRADRIDRDGRVQSVAGGRAAIVRAVGDRARADRLLRRLVRRAAQRAPAAEAERGRKGPRPGDEQRPQYRRHHAGVRRRSTLLGDVARPDRDPDHRRRGRLHARVEHLRAGEAAGLLRPVLAVAAHAHDLPDQDRRPAEHPAARPGADHRESRVDDRRRAGRRVHSAIRPIPRVRPVLPARRSFTGCCGACTRFPITAGNRQEVVEAIERGARRAGGRPRRLHLRGRRRQPHRQPAAVQARLRADRAGSRRADRAGVSRSRLGQHLQLQARKFFWKLPERLPYPVTVAFGEPLPSTVEANEVRLAIMELGRGGDAAPPNRVAICCTSRSCASRAGATGALRDGRQHRPAADATADAGRRRCVLGARDPATHARTRRTSALLLPASVGGALANIATLMAGKVPVNLNFTIGPEALDAAIEQAEIRTILTSAQFLAQGVDRADARMVFLEDLRKTIGLADKLLGALEAVLTPARWLGGAAGRATRRTSLATIIFSSGSTGVPKGVMLTHANLLANVDALAQIFPMTQDDCFIGVLPFFHSFGFTGTLWFPLLQGCGMAYHPNPMDAKTDRRAGREVPRQHAHQHADVLPGVPAALHAGAVRAPEVRDRRRREAAPVARGRVQGTVRRRSARGLRLHRDGARRARQPAGRHAPRTTSSSARSPARSAIRFPAWRPRSSTRTPARARSSARRACCSSRART